MYKRFSFYCSVSLSRRFLDFILNPVFYVHLPHLIVYNSYIPAVKEFLFSDHIRLKGRVNFYLMFLLNKFSFIVGKTYRWVKELLQIRSKEVICCRLQGSQP